MRGPSTAGVTLGSAYRIAARGTVRLHDRPAFLVPNHIYQIHDLQGEAKPHEEAEANGYPDDAQDKCILSPRSGKRDKLSQLLDWGSAAQTPRTGQMLCYLVHRAI